MFFISVSAFDWSFCVYFCMFPVCPLCCFTVISMDPVSEINDDDDDIYPRLQHKPLVALETHQMLALAFRCQ